jgi:DNA-binding transcriptional ArsR family regulator
MRSFMVGAVSAGWSFEHVMHAALDRVNRGGAKAQDLYDLHGAARARKYLEREYLSARRFVARNQMVLDRNGAYLAITEWLEAADRVPWSGSAGLTDRNTLDAMADQARRTGSSTSVPMSVRTLAERIGVGSPKWASASTASRSLKRLTASGWLRLVKRSNGAHPALYALRVPGSEADGTSPHTALAREVVHLLHKSPAEHDAWRWKALGKGPRRVYELLEISRAAEIASILGVTPRAVYHHLAKLRDAGLAESVGGLWFRTAKDLDIVAVEFGTLDQGFEQRARHQRQRDGWHGPRVEQ